MILPSCQLKWLNYIH